MPIQKSGAISLGDMRSHFDENGGTISFADLYRGKKIKELDKGADGTEAQNKNVPTTGKLSMDVFYGVWAVRNTIVTFGTSTMTAWSQNTSKTTKEAHNTTTRWSVTTARTTATYWNVSTQHSRSTVHGKGKSSKNVTTRWTVSTRHGKHTATRWNTTYTRTTSEAHNTTTTWSTGYSKATNTIWTGTRLTIW